MTKLTEDRAFSENYFNFISSAVTANDPLSNEHFSKTEIPEPAEQRELLKTFDQLKGHKSKIEALSDLCKLSFKTCAPNLRAGFNFLCYGFGRKQDLLDQIIQDQFQDYNVFTLIGSSEAALNLGPIAHFNCLLTSIQTNLFPKLSFNSDSASKASILSKTDLICSQKSSLEKSIILLHQFDSPTFRSPVIYDCLLKLLNCNNSKFSLIASIDNPAIVNMFTKDRFEAFNWIWMDCTTMIPYSEELNRFTIDACTNSAVKQTPRAAIIVLQSLTSNSRSIFKLLAAYQLSCNDAQVSTLIDSFEEEDDSLNSGNDSGVTSGSDGYSGMSYHGLFQKCQENFVVTAEANFRTQLTEFTDHDLFKSIEVKFLELAQVNSFNNLLGNLMTPDGGRLQIRIEVFTCKASGNDKRLLRQLEKKYCPNITEATPIESLIDLEDLDLSSTSLSSNASSTSNNTNNNTAKGGILVNGINLKIVYFLISTMNNMFPDYDFSEIPSEAFLRINSLATLRHNFNTSIFNSGINSNTLSFAEFTRKIWDCIDEAVGGLDESEIFSFDPEPFEIDDPFRERGTIWSLNAFFYNRKSKRVLVCYARQLNDFNVDDLGAFRSGSITPISST